MRFIPGLRLVYKKTAMLRELDNLLDGNLADSVLISSSNTDGDFLLHHFLGKAIGGSYSRIIVLALAQTVTHYNAVAQKLGVGLKSACESGRVMFLDCLSPSHTSTKVPVHQVTLDPDEDDALFKVYKLIKENCSPSVVILIDDLTMLVNLGFDVRTILDFCQHCMSLCATTGSFVAYIRNDINDAGVVDDETDLVQMQLRYWCSLHIHASGLSSGYSRAVHGDMSIHQSCLAQRKPNDKAKVTRVQYQVHEKGISIFAKGTSAAVL